MLDATRTIAARLIGQVQRGNETAIEQLFALLYDELRQLARRQRQRWRDDHTFNTTALVHEAYLKLVGGDGLDVESRAHFLAVAATAMRYILCNRGRDRRALKRGAGLVRISLNDRTALPAQATDAPADELMQLDEALNRLEEVDPRQSRVVECRFFAGLTVEETAVAIGVSPRTVKRDWAVAQAWLHREMTAGG